MNRKIATFVVTVLVFAMVGTIAWNEFVQGSRGAGEYGSTGARELGSRGCRKGREHGSQGAGEQHHSTRTH